MKSSALLPLVRRFFEANPVSAARSLESMETDEAGEVLKNLPPALTAALFPHLQIEHAAALLSAVPQELLGQILERLSPHQGALLLAQVREESRARILEHLPEKTKREIQELLVYPADSAGRIMTTDFLAFHADIQVKDAVQRIRAAAQKKSPAAYSYAYVTDAEGKLVGVMNMRDLLVAPGDAVLESVMRREVFSVDGFMDREEVVNVLSRRGYFAAPVVDAQGRLIGVVKTEKLLRGVQEEASEDLLKLFGAGGDERTTSSFSFSLRKRLPWLHVNLATAFLAASVVALFENVIAEITVLAVFLPVVAGQGGNAGAQSLAVVMRGLVMREIPKEKRLGVVLRETGLGAVNGAVIGVAVALIAWAWKGNPYLGLVIGLAMVVNLVAAGLSGAAIPLALKALGRDPAQSSSILLTTVTDVIGFFAFLGIAVLFRAHLV